MKSRRIGFSEVVSFRCACRAAGIDYNPYGPSARIKPVPQNIISAGHEQAKDFLARSVKHLRALEVLYKGKLIASEGKIEVTLTNGVKLKAFSSYPNTIRGAEGDVVLDEFAAVRDQPGVWAAAQALRLGNLGNPQGYKLVVVFTPLGDANMAYQIARGTMKEAFSHHTITIDQAVDDGFPLTKDDKKTGLRVPATIEDFQQEFPDPGIFGQEFRCDFMSASDRYIPETVYNAACYDGEPPAGFHAIGATRAFGGLDLARTMDLTAFARLQMFGDVLWQTEPVEVLRSNRAENPDDDPMGWQNQKRWVDERMRSLERLAADASSLGSQFSEELEQRWPGQVDSVKFGALGVKEELATGLKLGLQNKRVRVLQSDTDLRREVLSMRREISKLGTMRYHTPREKGSHGDRAWALALAIGAAGGAARAPVTPGVTTLASETGHRSRWGGVRPGSMWGK